MGAPSGAPEIAAYAARQRTLEHRVFIELDYPAMTAAKSDSFNDGELNPLAWESNYLTSGPLESNTYDAGGEVKIQGYGTEDPDNIPPLHPMPSFEWLRTRANYGWFPSDYYFPFEMVVTYSYPNPTIKYTPPIIVSGLENIEGDASDPVLIFQVCEAQIEVFGALLADEGNVFMTNYGDTTYQAANNLGLHTLKVRWDPLHLASSYSMEVLIDDVQKFNTVGGALSRPVAFQAGWSWPQLQTPAGVPVYGDVSETALLNIHYFEVKQLGSYGYESRIDPEWLLGNSGQNETTLDNVDPGEYYTDSRNGKRYARIPNRYLSSISGEKGVVTFADNANIELNLRPFDSQVEDLLVWPWARRVVMIDTRHYATRNPSDITAWRRLFAGFIKTVESDQAAGNFTATLKLRSIIEELLDIYVSRGWRGEATDLQIKYPIDKTVADILMDMCRVAEAFSGGGPLGVIYDLIQDMPIVVNDIGSLGQSQLSLFAQLIDQVGYEYYVDYSVSTASMHFGRLRVHAATTGLVGNVEYDIPWTSRFVVNEDTDGGPGQVVVSQNDDTLSPQDLAGSDRFPSSGMYPTIHYPSTAKPLTDSIAYTRALQAATGPAGIIMYDKVAQSVTGGVAAHRFRLESGNRRRATVDLQGYDNIEPADIVSFAGVLYGQLHSAIDDESWVVDKISWSIKDSVFESTLGCRTVWWEEAIRRSL